MIGKIGEYQSNFSVALHSRRFVIKPQQRKQNKSITSFLRIAFSVNGYNFVRYFGLSHGAGSEDDVFRIIFCAGEVAVRHSLVASHGNDFDAEAYEKRAELPQRLKLAVTVRDKADVLWGIVPRNSEIVINCLPHLIFCNLSRDLF